MPRPWRIRYAGAKYHVTTRGNGRARIFLGTNDYLRFLDQLGAALEADRVILYAYCLMQNHIHLHVETPHANLPRFMQRLSTAYGMYFRYKKQRPGHCFQGRYGAKVVQGDDYLLRLTRYIHLNPINTREYTSASVDARKRALGKYPWSSYRSYAGLVEPEEIVDYRWLKLMGRATLRGNQAAYRRYIQGFIGERDEVLRESDKESRYAIGEKRFREEMEEAVSGVRRHKADHGDIVWPQSRTIPVEMIIDAVAEKYKVRRKDLIGHGRRLGIVKAVAIELCCRLSGRTQRDIASYFGYRSESSVGKQRQTLAKLIEKDPSLQRRIRALSRSLEKSRI